MTGPLAPVVLSSGALASAAYYICSNLGNEDKEKEKEKDENENENEVKEKEKGGKDTSKEKKANKA